MQNFRVNELRLQASHLYRTGKMPLLTDVLTALTPVRKNYVYRIRAARTAQRNRNIITLVAAGIKAKDIAPAYGISPQRVRQIVAGPALRAAHVARRASAKVERKARLNRVFAAIAGV